MFRIFGLAVAVAAVAAVYGGTVYTIVTETADALTRVSAILN